MCDWSVSVSVSVVCRSRVRSACTPSASARTGRGAPSSLTTPSRAAARPPPSQPSVALPLFPHVRSHTCDRSCPFALCSCRRLGKPCVPLEHRRSSLACAAGEGLGQGARVVPGGREGLFRGPYARPHRGAHRASRVGRVVGCGAEGGAASRRPPGAQQGADTGSPTSHRILSPLAAAHRACNCVPRIPSGVCDPLVRTHRRAGSSAPWRALAQRSRAPLALRAARRFSKDLFTLSWGARPRVGRAGRGRGRRRETEA